MIKLNVPTAVTVVLGLVAGILTVLVHNTFGFSVGWSNYAATILVFLSVLGINPLVGSAFRNALHLSPAVTLVITALLTAAAFGVTQIGGISHDAVGIVQGIIAFAGALGFGTVPVAAAKRGRFV